jgi:hypothetical protein
MADSWRPRTARPQVTAAQIATMDVQIGRIHAALQVKFTGLAQNVQAGPAF